LADSGEFTFGEAGFDPKLENLGIALNPWVITVIFSEPNEPARRSTPWKLDTGFRDRNDAVTQTTLNGKQALLLAVALFVHG